jgi:damage-control phosphatase, subfamily I
MKLILDCYPCMLRQVLSTAKLSGLNEQQTKTVIDRTMQMLLEVSAESSPQHIIVRIIDYIKNKFHVGSNAFDPYGELKQRSNKIVMEHFERLEATIQNAANPLETALKIAAAGNIIDFGAKDHGSIDIEKEIRNIPSLQFSRYDYQPFLNRLSRAERILYIGDNAGEIVFDRLFIRRIKREFPSVKIAFATRSEPVINDVTVEDARTVGLDREAEIVSSGCRYPGLMLAEASESFKGLWKKADVIIAKGQGNFEGLSNEDDGRLFFILRIKCDRVAGEIGASVGDLVLFQMNETITRDI